jgi:hypothetical protein
MRLALPTILLCAGLYPCTASAGRLPATVVPEHYGLAFTIDMDGERFSGGETINVRVAEATSQIVFNALDLDVRDATIAAGGATQKATVSFDRAQETATLTVARRLAAGPAEIRLRFTGALNTRLRGPASRGR